MEEQIIGRGQRLGREKPLNIYYLTHENEYQNNWINHENINHENINDEDINDEDMLFFEQ